MRTCLAAALISLLGVCSFVRAGDVTRIWTDTQGRSVEATFAGMEGDAVLLQTRDGRTHRVPLANLTADDQQAARTLKPVGINVPTNIPASQAAATMIQRTLAELSAVPMEWIEGR